MVDLIDIAARPGYRPIDYLILAVGRIKLNLFVHVSLRRDESFRLLCLLLRLGSRKLIHLITDLCSGI